ncbi:hypothetical protein [Streptomyces radicis]|uniref:DUF4190 domain-containing protein n=1 Tax=Streptomyces radicis TaxID=1750517 RepID=A0A3A9WBB3_9ACTN|nr:hypothetical protein [Streptomyces radicis]RKN06684.1 hypothetical protein D7319_21455 [Streptomyces radicis]RKN19309.1 hypothetical protein D7318_20920 [Streptomyces radicis]
MTADPYAGWPPPQGVYAAPPAPAPPRNGVGTAALLLGGGGAFLCWTFAASFLGLACGLLATALGAWGVVRARRGIASNRGEALGALWLGIGSTVISAVLTVLFVLWASGITGVASAAGDDYLAAAGDEVAFDDGVTVVIAEPLPSGGADTVSLEITVVNGGEGPLDMGEGALRVFTGDERVPNELLELTSPAPDELATGESARLAYRVPLPDPGAGYLSVDFAPGEDHAFGYWDLALGDGGSGDPEGPGDTDDAGDPSGGISA